jgi:adenylate kinase
VLQRLAVYRAQTAPLLAHYGARGVLRRIDASGSPADVARRAVAALAASAPVAQ